MKTEYKKDYLIKEYKYWKVELHQNQCYLERCRIWYKGEVIDFFSISVEELEELFKIEKNLKKALKKLFSPDKYNYYIAGNVDPQLHPHFIPRYKEGKKFEGMIFRDENWGKNHAPYNREFETPNKIITKLIEVIRENLDKYCH